MKFVKIGNYIFNAANVKRLALSSGKIHVIDDEGHSVYIDFGGEIDAKSAFEQAARDLTWVPVPALMTTTQK